MNVNSKRDSKRVISTSCNVPDTDCLVEPARNQEIGLWTEVDAKNEIGMSFQDFRHCELRDENKSNYDRYREEPAQTVSTLHIQMVLSSEAEAMYSPSCDQAISDIPSE